MNFNQSYDPSDALGEEPRRVNDVLSQIGLMHRLYEEYVDSSVLWLLLKKKKIDRRDIIAKLVGRSGISGS